VAALAAALYHRQRTGEGQHIDLSQVEAALHFIEPVLLDYTVNGRIAQPAGHEAPTATPHGVYRTRGVEEYVTIACETAHQWLALRSVAPLEAFAEMKFDTLETRLAHDAEIDSVVEAWCADQDGRALAEQLKRAGVPAAYVCRPSDLYEDAQLAHRDFFKVLNHTVMGPTPYDGPVTMFSETPPAYAPAPCLGEHTHEVLTEMLGLSEDEIVRYAAAGALQ
jgi:benzylsuccinate CoA-transferase BbsF subunit